MLILKMCQKMKKKAKKRKLSLKEVLDAVLLLFVIILVGLRFSILSSHQSFQASLQKKRLYKFLWLELSQKEFSHYLYQEVQMLLLEREWWKRLELDSISLKLKISHTNHSLYLLKAQLVMVLACYHSNEVLLLQ